MARTTQKTYRKHGFRFVVDYVENGRVYVRRWKLGSREPELFSVTEKVWRRSFGKVD